jgi:cell shape-determining protein MreC
MQRRYKRKNQDFTGYQQDIKAVQAENTRFKEDLQKAPDPLELV